jgi:hypothetical protein
MGQNRNARNARKKINGLLKKSNGKCHYCNRRILNHRIYPEFKLLERGWFSYKHKNSVIKALYATVDHVIPRSKGGTNKLENLVASCYRCNNEKDRVVPTRKLGVCVTCGKKSGEKRRCHRCRNNPDYHAGIINVKHLANLIRLAGFSDLPIDQLRENATKLLHLTSRLLVEAAIEKLLELKQDS